MDKIQDEKASLIKLNFLRKTYDHAFARGNFSECINAAKQARGIAPKTAREAPRDFTQSPGDVRANSLSEKFWHYLELCAAVELEITPETQQMVKKSLLSVPEPCKYFADEREYMVVVCDEFCEWYETPYGDSIIENGLWLDSVNSLISAGYLNTNEAECADNLAIQLKEMSAPTHED